MAHEVELQRTSAFWLDRLERQRLEEVVDGLLELNVRVPRAQLLGHLLARQLELLELLDHERDVGLVLVVEAADLGPRHLVELAHAVDHARVERVQPVEQLELALGALEVD